MSPFRVRDHSLTVAAQYRHTVFFRAARVSKRSHSPSQIPRHQEFGVSTLQAEGLRHVTTSQNDLYSISRVIYIKRPSRSTCKTTASLSFN